MKYLQRISYNLTHSETLPYLFNKGQSIRYGDFNKSDISNYDIKLVIKYNKFRILSQLAITSKHTNKILELLFRNGKHKILNWIYGYLSRFKIRAIGGIYIKASSCLRLVNFYSEYYRYVYDCPTLDKLLLEWNISTLRKIISHRTPRCLKCLMILRLWGWEFSDEELYHFCYDNSQYTDYVKNLLKKL